VVYAPFVAVMPMPAWAALWGGVGALTGVGAGWRPARPWAFATAALVKATWGMVYLVGWLAGDMPRGYLSAAIWCTFAAVVLIISAWPEREPT